MSYYYNLLKHSRRLSLGPVFNKENRACLITFQRQNTYCAIFSLDLLSSVESRESASNRGAEYSYILAESCSNNVE